MTQSGKKHLKPSLTIAAIGKLRFFIGLVLGLSYTIIFYAFCIGIRDGALALTNTFTTAVNVEGIHLFNAFIAGISGCLGLHEMLHFCLSNQWKIAPPRKRNVILNHIRGYHYGLLFVAFRFITLVWVMLFSRYGSAEDIAISNVVSMESYLWLSLVFIIFFQKWKDIQRFYRCKPWLYVSLMVLIAFIWVLPKWEVTAYQKVLPKLKKEEQFEKTIIESMVQRANEYFAKARPDYPLENLDFYTPITYLRYEDAERYMTRSAGPEQLLLLKFGVQFGKLNDYLTYRPINIAHFLMKEMNTPEKYGIPTEKDLLIIEVIDECQRYLKAKELTEDEFHQLTYEEKFWYLKIIEFHNWKRPRFVWKDGEPDYQFMPQDISDEVELAGVDEMATEDPDYIELTPERMLQVSTQLDSLKGVLQKRLADKK